MSGTAARAALLALGLLCTARALAAEPATAWLLVRDAEVRSEGRAAERVPVASLAKLMTAVLWLQKPERLGQKITVSARAAAATGARAGIVSGARYAASDLLTAMLVKSANDACLALAEQAAGSVESFVKDMNRAAALLELAETHYVNPCGWDAEGQYSSARDSLSLARLAMEYPEVRERVALGEFTLRSQDGRHVHRLRSTNLLLGNLEGVFGVKTGFTARAGKCLVAAARRGDREVWLVLLGAPERWWTAHALIESAFDDPARH